MKLQSNINKDTHIDNKYQLLAFFKTYYITMIESVYDN